MTQSYLSWINIIPRVSRFLKLASPPQIAFVQDLFISYHTTNGIFLQRKEAEEADEEELIGHLTIF